MELLRFPLRPVRDDAQLPLFSQGSLALSLLPQLDPPEPEVARPRLRLVSGGERAARHEVEQWAARYVQAAIEIVGGDRPAHQLTRWSAAEVLRDLQRRADAVGTAGGHVPGTGRVLRSVPRVVAAHASFPAPDVAEVALRSQHGPRFRAVAARFDRMPAGTPTSPDQGLKWLCTRLTWG